jgi:hypothetical protein
MSIRSVINNHPQFSAVVVAVVMVFSVGSMVMRGRGRDEERHQYAYYMMPQTGQVLVDVSGQLPPLESGAVRAVVFSCGDCSDKSTHFVGWIEKYTDEAKAIMERLRAAPPMPAATPYGADQDMDDMMAVEEGHFIATAPDGLAEPQWVVMGTPPASALMRATQQRCGQSARMCSPLPSERY